MLPPLSASPPTPPPLSASPSAPESNPFAGARFYVNPNSNAAQTEAAWRSSGRSADANAMAKIANNPQATWFGDWNGSDPYAAVHNAVSQAAGAGALPVLVTYNIPGRDCGSLSAGGAVSANAYHTFIDGFVRGIANARAIVIVEPDALAELDCMSTGNQQQTLELLRYAVAKFAASPGTAVYLDAGNSTWQPAAVIASRLQQADVAQARGFSLNISNFNSTATEESYGNSVSALLGGKHFLVDTSRNGQGRASDSQWCNPSGRGLGIPASTVTGDPLADALFWVKSPGESDGTCNSGPTAGSWWPEYALGLAQRAAF
ncbi:MAG: glycoside hydrolase family 6 protein [Solirubrobacteraceae bacterium]